MKGLARQAAVVSAFSLALLVSGCSSFDPSDIMDNLFASQKKPLPGERKELFPGGTPGVSQGLPPDLVKGYQPPPPTVATGSAQNAQAAPDQANPKLESKPESKPKSKPKPKVAAAPPATPASAPSASQAAPWPGPPSTNQSAAPAGPGQTVWPDPPAPGTVTR